MARQEQHIGGALGLEEQNQDKAKARVIEDFSLTLETIVSKINTISDNILTMEKN